MKRKLYWILSLIILMGACHKLPTMKQEVVNLIDVNEFISQNEGEKENLNSDFFYGNDSLYISDQKNQRILGIDGNNQVFLEIGNLKSQVSDHSKNFWEKELQNFLSELDEKERVITKEKKNVTPRKKIRKEYAFNRIAQIISDFNQNIYVAHYTEPGMEILKFDSEGKFIYRIGEEGRDNPHFKAEAKVINLYITPNNGLWVKYLDQGMLKLRYYNDFGKNILFFEESRIEPSVHAHVARKENERYQIEDIFPVPGKNQIATVINVYRKQDRRFEIERKLFFQMNQKYGVENYWEFENKRLQVFNINLNQNLVCFSYFTKERTPILKMFDLDGERILEKKITLQRFNYRRMAVSLTQNGELMGAFLKKNILYFVLWK